MTHLFGVDLMLHCAGATTVIMKATAAHVLRVVEMNSTLRSASELGQ
jgi:hypothetical protein